jgi:hypothetical protein
MKEEFNKDMEISEKKNQRETPEIKIFLKSNLKIQRKATPAD